MAAEELAEKAGKLAEGGIKATLDVIEETVDTLEGVYDWRCGLSRKQHVAQLVGLGLLAGAVGGFVAYHVCRKRLEARFNAELDLEIAKTKAYYNDQLKDGVVLPAAPAVQRDPGEASVHEAAGAIVSYGGKVTPEEEAGADTPEEQTEATVSSIFTQQMDEDFDLETEMSRRSDDHPYIITSEEFMQAERDYEQSTLTYYGGDDTLTDEKDEPIPPHMVDVIVGEENLRRFGHGSGDPRTVYIRNEKMNADYEVVLHEGKYAHEVLGELHHSDVDPAVERITRRRGSD